MEANPRHVPDLSVLVPVYGVERYIADCARSLFAQRDVDAEFVFVDDASPDGSVDRLREQPVFEQPHRLAGVIGHPLPRTGGLHAAFGHRIDKRIALPTDAGGVEVGIKPQPKRCGKPFQPRMLGQSQKRLDAPGFDDGKAPPGLGVMLHCLIHTALPFD